MRVIVLWPQRIRQLVTDPRVREVDAAILVMLYALRHEGHPNTDLKGLVSALNKRNVSDRYLKVGTKSTCMFCNTWAYECLGL